MRLLLLSVSFSLIALWAFARGTEVFLMPKPDLHLKASPKHLFGEGVSVSGRALSFGYYQFDSERLNNYLGVNSSVNGTFAANYMGIGLDDISFGENHFPDLIGSLQYVLPQKVSAGPNDSLKLKLSGWHYTMSFLGFDVVPGTTVTLAIAPQISYGNFIMRREIAGQKTKYANPFIAPGGRVEFRLVLGNFTIGARATYRYDITHDLWKRKDDMMPVMPEYKNNGMAYFGYIGLVFED